MIRYLTTDVNIELAFKNITKKQNEKLNHIYFSFNANVFL